MPESFNSDEFRKQREEIEKIADIQQKLNESNVGLFEVLKDIHRYDKLIADQLKKKARLIALEEKVTKRITELNEKKVVAGSEEEEQLVAKLINLEEERDLIRQTIRSQDKKIDKHKLANRLIKDQVRETKTLSKLIATSVNTGLKKGVAIAKKGFNYYIEQDTAVRNTGKSIGLLNKQADAFANNIYKASLNTNQLGIEAKDLAKIQSTYSNEIGRSILLSEEGLNAISEMAAGTSLGAEGAAAMAANMESFGLSASMSRDILQETVDLAHTMGVNADVAINNLSKNLKLAQGYNFKKGVKGISTMSVQAAKFKISMESVASIADKLIDVEGAVNMAAQLQVLGGEWSKMADPFKLMYQARNDIEGLQTSLINAVKATAQFNKNTGEFDISAMEMHRLRKVAEQLGVDYKELAESAKEAAKFSKIRGEISADIDPVTKEFIESTATFNKSKGGYEIMIGSEPKLIRELSTTDKTTLKSLAVSKESLAQRAKDSQTIDKMWENLMNTFKSVFLPFMRGIDSGIRQPLEAFMKSDRFDKIMKNLANFGETLGKGIGKLGELIVEFPKTSLAIGAGIMAAIGGVKWYMHGVTLGLGFNSVAGVGGNGGFGIADKLTGGKFGKVGKAFGKSKGVQKLAGLSKFGKIATGVGSLGAGIVGSYAGGKLSEMSGHEDTATGDISSMVGGIIGGALGTLLGPVGTVVGAGLGSAAGKWVGDAFASDSPSKSVAQDFVMRPGEGAVPFSSSDTLVGAKPNGPIDKMLNNSMSNGSSNGEINVIFNKPLEIKGEITLNSGNSSQNIKLNDPILMREIASMVQQEIRKSMGGGVLNPNPL